MYVHICSMMTPIHFIKRLCLRICKMYIHTYIVSLTKSGVARDKYVHEPAWSPFMETMEIGMYQYAALTSSSGHQIYIAVSLDPTYHLQVGVSIRGLGKY